MRDQRLRALRARDKWLRAPRARDNRLRALRESDNRSRALRPSEMPCRRRLRQGGAEEGGVTRSARGGRGGSGAWGWWGRVEVPLRIGVPRRVGVPRPPSGGVRWWGGRGGRQGGEVPPGLNPKPYILNLKPLDPETPHPFLETPNTEPQTVTLKTRVCQHGRASFPTQQNSNPHISQSRPKFIPTYKPVKAHKPVKARFCSNFEVVPFSLGRGLNARTRRKLQTR